MSANGIKNEEWVCPKCGSDDCESYDTDFDWECMVRKMTCNHCDHSWREYFKIKYDGYTDNSGEYDANGVQCVNYEEDE